MSFWRLFHNLVRHDDTQPEVDRATEACVWLADNILSVRKVCSSQQIEIIAAIHTFWFNHRSAPSLNILRETLERKATGPGVLEELNSYEEQEGMSIFGVADLGQLLHDMIEEWQSERLATVLKVAKAINNGSWKDPKTKKQYEGPMDAAKYMLQQVQEGITFSSQKSLSGALDEMANEIYGIYERNKAYRQSGSLRIRTGIHQIDQQIPIKRGDFIGVLGYAGQRKTTLCRTIAYNAAMAGFNVLHVTLEQTYDEERSNYAIIHSAHPKFIGKHKISKKKFDDGELSDEDEKFLRDVVIPDMEQNIPGKLIIRQPVDGSSWPAIKLLAEVTDQTTPIDLFYIDYLTLCATSSKDSKQEHEANIKDAKQTALQWRNGEGCVMLTPVQGNRAGWDAAKESGGVWDMTGVYMYSEFDKSVDTMLTVFIDTEAGESNTILIASAKTRRCAPLAVFEAPLDIKAGKVVNAASAIIEVAIDPTQKKQHDDEL